MGNRMKKPKGILFVSVADLSALMTTAQLYKKKSHHTVHTHNDIHIQGFRLSYNCESKRDSRSLCNFNKSEQMIFFWDPNGSACARTDGCIHCIDFNDHLLQCCSSHSSWPVTSNSTTRTRTPSKTTLNHVDTDHNYNKNVNPATIYTSIDYISNP